MSPKKEQAQERLQRLAGDLKKAYTKAARHVALSLAPLEAAVAEIGETWRPPHYAESLRTHGPDDAVRPPGNFAHESLANGDETDYLLCVGRTSETKCSLFVSICKYHVRPSSRENGGDSAQPEVSIKSSLLAPPSAIPVPLRLKILDILDEFAEGYEQHVRDVRKQVLTGWDTEGEAAEPQKDDAQEASLPEAIAEAAPERKSPEPLAPVVNAAKPKSRVNLDELNVSAESWLQGKR